MIIIHSLGYDICSLARKIHQNLSAKFKDFDITPEQWVVLKKLLEEDKISQKELSLRVEKDQNNIKAIVDKLEKKSYLLRQENPRDKRAFFLFLTEKGREIIQKLQPLDDEMLVNLSKGLTENEIKNFKIVLLKIEKNLFSQLK